MTNPEIKALIAELERAIEAGDGGLAGQRMHAAASAAIVFLQGQRDAALAVLWALASQNGGTVQAYTTAMEGYRKPGNRLMVETKPLSIEVRAETEADRQQS